MSTSEMSFEESLVSKKESTSDNTFCTLAPSVLVMNFEAYIFPSVSSILTRGAVYMQQQKHSSEALENIHSNHILGSGVNTVCFETPPK